MIHSFWLWVSTKSQEAFVKNIRHTFREHMKNKPKGMDYGNAEWTNWNDKKEQTMHVLKKEVERLYFMEAQ
jgi:hypothetical protein